MKQSKHIIYSLIFLIMFGSLSFAAKNIKDHHYSILDHISIDIDGTTLILKNKYDKSEFIEITRSYNLYIDGEKIALTRSQKKMLARYYNQFFEITEYAIEIGEEGAEVGIMGARIGVRAAAGAIKAVFSDYESEELNEELEDEAEKLQSLVEELEEKAEEIEEMADEFEELHKELRYEIEELHELRWF